MTSPMLPLVFATIFVTASVLFMALSFATDHWQETIVQRGQLKVLAKDSPTLKAKLATPLYFSRNRGMFRTCYPGNETLFLDAVPNKVDDCIPESGYEIPNRNEDTISWGDDYETHIHLMRSHFAFFVVGLLLLVVSSIMGAIGCWKMEGKTLRSTGLISFFGAFFGLGGMAFFHGYEFLENARLDITDTHFPAYWTTDPEHATLANYSSTQYGYSYMMGWIGVGMAAISAILFLCAAMSSSDLDDDSSASPLAKKAQPSRNRAYEYMGGNQSVMGGGSMVGGPVMGVAPPVAQQQAVVPAVMAPQQPVMMYDYGQTAAAQQQQYAASNLGYDYGTGTYGRY